MKERGVPEDFRSQYLGHENDSVNHRTYGGMTPPKFLLEQAIPHLMFDEIKWDAIHYKSDMDAMKRQMEIAARRDRKKDLRKSKGWTYLVWARREVSEVRNRDTRKIQGKPN